MPTIETLRGDDGPQRDELARLAFGMPEPRPPERPRPAPDQSVAAYDGDRVVAHVAVLSDAHWFGRRAVACGGVTSVVVAPDQRGRGLARAVVSEAIRRSHQRGDAISTLFPTTATLYRTLGYEIAGWYRSTEIPVAMLAGMSSSTGNAGDPSVVVEPGSPDDVDAAYDLTAPGYDGWLRRSDAARSLLRFDHDHLRLPKAIFRAQRGDTTVGALLYSERNSGARFFDVIASQLFATDTDALRALLAVIGAHGTMANHARTFLPPDVLALAVPHAQLLQTAMQAPWMLRLLDAPRAIAQRGYAHEVDVDVDLEISGDDLLPSNNGRFVLRVHGGDGVLEPGGRGTTAVDIRSLAAHYAGFAGDIPALRAAFSGRSATLVDFF